MTTVKYGEFTLDLSTLPETSLLALVSSGFAHKMGNEVASRVAAAVVKSTSAGEVVDDEVKAKIKSQFQTEMFEKILAGTVGVSTRTPGAPKEDTLKRQIILKSLTTQLKAHGLPLPTKDNTISIGGNEFTREALVAAHYAKHKERLDGEIAAEKKRRDKEAVKLAVHAGEDII